MGAASRLDAAITCAQAQDALVAMGWRPSLAGPAVCAASAALGAGAPLEQLIVEALRRCPGRSSPAGDLEPPHAERDARARLLSSPHEPARRRLDSCVQHVRLHSVTAVRGRRDDLPLRRRSAGGIPDPEGRAVEPDRSRLQRLGHRLLRQLLGCMLVLQRIMHVARSDVLELRRWVDHLRTELPTGDRRQRAVLLDLIGGRLGTARRPPIRHAPSPGRSRPKDSHPRANRTRTGGSPSGAIAI